MMHNTLIKLFLADQIIRCVIDRVKIVSVYSTCSRGSVQLIPALFVDFCTLQTMVQKGLHD